MEEAVYYKEMEGKLYLRAIGHVTALVCPGLKARVFARLDSEPAVQAVYLDLSSCEYMDSTFLGLIVGTHKRFSGTPFGAKAGGQLVLIAPNETCIGLLRTIGVLGMVEIALEVPGFPAELEMVSDGSKASARFILEAHEDLAGLSAENKARFAALTAVLKGALDSDKDVGGS